MYFCHTPAIWADFPTLVPGLLLVEGVRAEIDAAPRVAPLVAQAQARLAETSEGELPEVQAWRRAFGQMGLKPTQYRSAAEALLRRIRKGEGLPALHPLVDICNAVSVAFALPVAALDLDQIEGFVEVGYAAGNEHYLAFNGEVEQPAPGEVIFVDAGGHAHARRWTFRQSRRSTVGAQTRRALIVSEALHAGALASVEALLATLAGELRALGMQPQGTAILAAGQPRWQLDAL
jgi:DNA/RNA-binding domain of Phe-tRNA-synthetase-like protein